MFVARVCPPFFLFLACDSVDPSRVVRAGRNAAPMPGGARNSARRRGSTSSMRPAPRSAFGGRLFAGEAEGELEHEYGTFAMQGINNKDGTFGSEFYIFLDDADTVAAAAMDEGNNQPFGVLVSGTGVLKEMERVMANIFHSSDSRKQHTLGGRPAVPMVISKCGETRMPPRSAEMSNSLRKRKSKRRNSTDDFLEMMRASKELAENVQKAGHAEGWGRDKINAEITGNLRKHTNSFDRAMVVGPSEDAEDAALYAKGSTAQQKRGGGGDEEEEESKEDAATRKQRRASAAHALEVLGIQQQPEEGGSAVSPRKQSQQSSPEKQSLTWMPPSSITKNNEGGGGNTGNNRRNNSFNSSFASSASSLSAASEAASSASSFAGSESSFALPAPMMPAAPSFEGAWPSIKEKKQQEKREQPVARKRSSERSSRRSPPVARRG